MYVARPNNPRQAINIANTAMTRLFFLYAALPVHIIKCIIHEAVGERHGRHHCFPLTFDIL
jgi:hypothetical protein